MHPTKPKYVCTEDGGRRFPRTLEEAFPGDPKNAIAITHYRTPTWVWDRFGGIITLVAVPAVVLLAYLFLLFGGVYGGE